ncbi:MAG: rRNA maturation RNase YbeY [Dehalococcoidales bacterium]|nr:rRNA maturation RNase YbeY [Dehalococcoidales bacterium]
MEISVLIDTDLKGCPEAGWLESLAERVLIAQGVDSKAELSLAIVGQEKIHQLNLRYLGNDEPTDVLSFSMLPEPSGGITPFVTPPDGIKHLGEVIISYPQAVIQAAEHQHSVQREIATLFIHGALHIVGFDHDEPERERQMRARETEILSHIEGELE